VRKVATIAGMVEQHAEDAAFLWSLRRAEVDGRRFGEADLGRLDQRLTAHLAGLVAAGEAGWEAALARFGDYPEAGEVFVLGALALHHGEAALLDRALSAAAAGDEGRAGFSGAIARSGRARLRPFVAGWLASADPALRYLGACALSHHRADGRLDDLLADPDAAVRVRALRLVGELGRRDLGPALQRAFVEGGEAERFRAAWSACLAGAGRAACPVLDRIVAEGGPLAGPAVAIRLVATPTEEGRAWLAALMGRGAVAGAVIAEVGMLGDRAAVPWLIRRMRAPETAFAAGAAFRDLFEIDFDDTDLFTEDPAALGPGFADLEDRPLPVADRVKAWWNEGRGPLPEETRPSLRQLALRALRAAAATPGRPLADWRRTRAFPAWM
jgi:uncharacterized protein (TIGR02270 family)